MNTPETIDIPRKSRGVPLWSALAALLVLAVAIIAALAVFLFITTNKNRQLARQQDDLARKQVEMKVQQQLGAENEKLTQAQNRQNDVLGQTHVATKVLEQLLGETDQLNAEAAALRSNDAGRKIALYPDLVAQAARFFDADLPGLPPREDVAGKLENLRLIKQQVSGDKGTAYEPNPELAATAAHLGTWGEGELGRVRRARALVAALLRQAKAKTPELPVTGATPTLETAMAQQAQAEAAFRQRVITEKTEEAKPQAIEVIVQAAIEKSLQDSRLQATNILASVTAMLQEQHRAQMLRDTEAQRREAETRMQITNVVNQLHEEESQQQRRITLDVADRAAGDQVAFAKAKQIEDNTEDMAKRQRLQDPTLLALLAPFTTPAYHQLHGHSFEKQPMSLQDLAGSGALDPTPRGVSKLVRIAMYGGDRERPRWHLRGGPLAWGHFAESVDKAKEAQLALIELGPAMVQVGLLSQ
jgi:hypothetical protein